MDKKRLNILMIRLDDIRSDLEAFASNGADDFGDKPDSYRESEEGQKESNDIDVIIEIAASLEEAVGSLEEIIGEQK